MCTPFEPVMRIHIQRIYEIPYKAHYVEEYRVLNNSMIMSFSFCVFKNIFVSRFPSIVPVLKLHSRVYVRRYT